MLRVLRFLSSKLLLQSLRSRDTIAQMLDVLKGPLSVTDMYRNLLDEISSATPWALKLIHMVYLLTIGGESKAKWQSVTALLRYLAYQDWTGGDLANHRKTVETMLSACRGLVEVNPCRLPYWMPVEDTFQFSRGFRPS